MEKLRDIATEQQKQALRRVKRADDPAGEVARHTLVIGCRDQSAYMQFGSDLSLYNLWEALLYAEGYEESQRKSYAPGTTIKAFNEAITKLQLN